MYICAHVCLQFCSMEHHVAASEGIIIEYIEKHNSIWKHCVSVCVARVWLGRQVSWTTNIVCRLVSTMASSPDLLTPWPNPNQNTTQSPCPEPPRTIRLQTPQSGDGARWLTSTADTQRSHTRTHVTHSVMRNNHRITPQQNTVCVMPQWFLSPSVFVCHQLTIMRIVGLDRKPCILCYYGSAIITQEVCLSWPQPPSGAAERRQNHL